MRMILAISLLAALTGSSLADTHNRGTCPPSICNPDDYGHPEWRDAQPERVAPTMRICESHYQGNNEITVCIDN